MTALWQTTVTSLVVLAIVWLLRSQSPRLRHAIVMIGILKFALPPVLPLPTGVLGAAPAVPVDGRVAKALLVAYLVGVGVMLARLAWESSRIRVILSRADGEGSPATGVHRGIPSSPGGPSLSAQLRTTRTRSDIRVSREIAVPMTFGIFRPVILLPASLAAALTPAELEAVIAHERQHIRRGDVLLNCLQALLGAIWWFDPFYHLLDRRARALREESCDDALIAEGRDVAQYARTLLTAAQFVARRPPLTAAGIAETPHSLLLRVRRLADARFTPQRRLGFGAIVLIATVALALLPGDNRVDHARRHVHVHH